MERKESLKVNDLLLMRELIREKTGIHFRDDYIFSLESSIRKRMETIGSDSIKQYHSKIIENKSELDILIDLITVNETYFLREPSHFKALIETIFPEILRLKPPGKKVRFLSAGCSTGEEPFSIVISLVEKYGASILDRIEVFGVDIDNNVINAARAGIYKSHSFRETNSQIREKYFTPKADAAQRSYEVSGLLKKVVEFQVLNLFDNQYPTQLSSMDVIFYRNVSIYFSADGQKKIFRNLSKLLVNDGYLFLASSETYFHNLGILFLQEMDNAFVYRKRIELPLEEHRARPVALPERTPTPARHTIVKSAKESPNAPAKLSASAKPIAPHREEDRRESHAMFEDALSLAIGKEYPAALLAIKSILEKDSSFKKVYSLKASILLNMQNISLAEEAVRTLLAIDEWDIEGLLLVGIIEKTKELDDEAIRLFKKAVFIKPQCWLAHFYLAELYYQKDDLRGAAYEYGIVASILEKNGESGHELTFFLLAFPTNQIARLCRFNIDKISRGLQKTPRLT